MKPTLDQLYKHSEFFIAKFEEAGLPNARAKIRGLLPHILDYRSVRGYFKSVERDRSRRLRHLDPMDPHYQKNDHAYNRLSRKKGLASLGTSVALYKAQTKRREEVLLRRIAKWPEIEFTTQEMKKVEGDTKQPVLKPSRRRYRFSSKYS